MGASVLEEEADPVFEVAETGAAGEREDDDRGRGVPEVDWGKALEFLLPSGVPDLDVDALAVDVAREDLVVRANSARLVLIEYVVDEPGSHGRFADGLGADRHDFVRRVLLEVHAPEFNGHGELRIF